mgnify:CR=1 FL=1
MVVSTAGNCCAIVQTKGWISLAIYMLIMCMVRIHHVTHSGVPNSGIPDFEYNVSGSSLSGTSRDASVL